MDVTGVTHLFGGASAILEEIRGAVEELGHNAHVALSDGPQLAKAFARWETRRRAQKTLVVTAGKAPVFTAVANQLFAFGN